MVIEIDKDPSFAVITTGSSTETSPIFPLKPAVVEPEGTMTEDGMEKSRELLVRATAIPPAGAAPDIVTEQVLEVKLVTLQRMD